MMLYFPRQAWLIFLLGISHAAFYALTTPPWGLLDEQQHFHYIQVLAQEHRLPRMWRDQLSPEIIDSIFAVKRHEITLHAPAMPTKAEFMASLEIESYEAYHPPLYYLVLSIVYLGLPHHILSQLFFLRLLGVILSSITLMVIWHSCQRLWPQYPYLAPMATLFVALHPERAAAVARVSNDIGLEISCALAFGCWAISLHEGLTTRRAALLGLSLSAAILTKLSASLIIIPMLLGWGFVAYRHKTAWLTQFGLIFAPVMITAGVIGGYNGLYYGDLTGLGAFIRRVGPLTSGDFLTLLTQGLLDLSNHSWVILWVGGQIGHKNIASLLIISLNLHLLLLTAALIYSFPATRGQVRLILSLSLLTIFMVISSTLSAYIQGFIPVVQARFLLPALVPIAWLIGFSLTRLPQQKQPIVAVSLLSHEIVLSLSSLFFHSLPQFYAPRDAGFLGYGAQTTYLLFLNPGTVFSDKPNWISLFLVILVGLVFSSTLLALLKMISPPHG